VGTLVAVRRREASTGHSVAGVLGTAGRLAGIEGLRGLAAATVVTGHVQRELADGVDFGGPGGALLALMDHGLTLFFALSGFLLFRPFVRAMFGLRAFPSLGRFFWNRCVRIFPAYWVILTVVAGVVGVAWLEAPGSSDGPAAVGRFTDPVMIATNVLMVQTLFPQTFRTGISVAWSLTVELGFYLVLPVLALAAQRLVGRFRRVPPGWFAAGPAVALIVLGAAGRHLVTAVNAAAPHPDAYLQQWGASWNAVLGRSFLVHADRFAYGMLAAVVLAGIEAGLIRRRSAAIGRYPLLAVGALVAMASRSTSWSDTGFAIAAGALILFVVLPGPGGGIGATARVLDTRPVRFLGLISYSTYLWHFPVIVLVAAHGWAFPATLTGWVTNLAVVSVLTLALSVATYYGVEKQALRRGLRPARSVRSEYQCASE